MKGWRKYKALLCILGIFSAIPTVFSASSHGWGKVLMSGEIVDTACTIETDSRDQIIDMGIIPLSIIKEFSKAPPKNFNIRLVGCRWERYSSNKNQWQTFDVTFDGPGVDNFFTVTGEAKGVQLEIRDEQGIQVIPGKTLPKKSIASGDMSLKYTLQLVTNHQRLQPGSYQTLLRFKIDYY